MIVCIQSKDTENALNNKLKIMKDVVISLIEKKSYYSYHKGRPAVYL